MKTLITKIILVAVLFVTACSKQKLPNNPAEVQGTYSGVITGSSGAYVINVKDNISKLSMYFDGQFYFMNSYEELNKGGAIHFSQADVSAIMSIDTNNLPSITFSIPDHTVEAIIKKKLNDYPIRNFIGTYETTLISSGAVTDRIYNITLYGENKLVGLTKNKTTGVIRLIKDGTFTATDSEIDITIDNSTKKLKLVGDNYVYSGTLNGEKETITLKEVKF